MPKKSIKSGASNVGDLILALFIIFIVLTFAFGCGSELARLGGWQ